MCLKMTQHLRSVHKNLTEEQIKEFAKMARVVLPKHKGKKKAYPAIKGQSQLGQYARGKAAEAPDPYKESVERGQGSTRAFPSFPLGKNNELDNFMEWLQGVEGKKRSPTQAREIATDVSKALW